ncbi:hypothetical protein BKA66DRAFT_551564 [Pyrenochaeta sp. MPI-SDFR-AT-0127]|nr:hypothetical protein BKA66DRAFT_551564 [Pyrenochaeta sp. MPI-SDFR-AT-0127]
MEMFYIFLSLILARTAIDIEFSQTDQYGHGWKFACTNAEPNVCCYVSLGMQSIAYIAVPEWHLLRVTTYDTRCNVVVRDLTQQQGGESCTGPGVFRAAYYQFVGDQMVQSVGSRNTSADASKILPQRVDAFINDESGLRYSIKHLDNSQLVYLMEQTNMGSDATKAAISHLKLPVLKAQETKAITRLVEQDILEAQDMRATVRNRREPVLQLQNVRATVHNLDEPVFKSHDMRATVQN